MSAYKHAFVISGNSTPERLALAADLLDDGREVVVLDGVVALRGTPTEILCEVVDPMPSMHRDDSGYRNLVDNAANGLKQSLLFPRLPKKLLRWTVVDDYGTGTVTLWPAA
jgi:hypothetical protein